ncbi:MAG TPA: HEAT repeat domain-containing protein [Anaeromyxobacter sp.]
MRLALAFAMTFLAGCSRGPGTVHVSSVRVADGTVAPALREAGLDEAALDDAAHAGLRAAGFALGEGGRPYLAEVSGASVRLAPPNASGGIPQLEVAVELALTPAQPGGGGTARETGTAAAPLAGGDPGVASRAALVQAARRAAEALMLAFAEEAKPLEKVIADLESRDPRLRDQAVRVLADRRAAAAVPALISRLKDEEPRIVHRAVGALAQIGDARAVGPLIDVSRSGDSSLTARVARLIGDIGGAEAEGYLLTLEAGHPDARVRKAAREALGEMRARAEQGGRLSARQ